jgi:hypothetical protein
MRAATNRVLKGTRKINPSILSLSDIDVFLQARPDQDGAIAGVFNRSGYLTFWKRSREQSPWQYSLALLSRAAENDPTVLAYCRDLVAAEEAGPSRFEVNWRGYRTLVTRTGLTTFRLLFELYDALLKDHRLRLGVAAEWLRRAGMLPPEPSPPAPHSPAWFAAVQRQNPLQAAMSRQVIALAGSAEVCSICGDDPAADYILADRRPVSTLRLCDDCRLARAGIGEHFVPLEDAAGGGPQEMDGGKGAADHSGGGV